MVGRLTWPIFWALVGVFIAIASVMAIPPFRELFWGSLFIISWAVFFLLGVLLIVLVVQGKARGMLRKLLILTGASSVGFIAFVLLHNAFYGLSEMTSHIAILSSVMGFFHMAFFIMAVPVCLIAFLVGVVGSIVLRYKK